MRFIRSLKYWDRLFANLTNVLYKLRFICRTLFCLLLCLLLYFNSYEFREDLELVVFNALYVLISIFDFLSQALKYKSKSCLFALSLNKKQKKI